MRTAFGVEHAGWKRAEMPQSIKLLRSEVPEKVDVSIIVVNYNTAEIIKACVDSVLKQVDVECELVIVDNASSDHSATTLAPLQSIANIQILLNQENIGFGRANNQAFQHSRGRYIFLLNPDAVLLAPDDLQRLIAFMDANPQCGLAGTRILKDATGRESLPAHFYPGEKSLQQKLPALPGVIAWVLGASMIIRREVYESVHGFDEDYFLYAEEADLCLRIRQQGHVIEQCSAVAVRHIGGISESSVPTEQVQRKKQAALYLFYKKHYSSAEISRLVRRDRTRALIRLVPLIVQKYVGSLNTRQFHRYHKYRAVYQTAKAFLQAQTARNPAADFNVL